MNENLRQYNLFDYRLFQLLQSNTITRPKTQNPACQMPGSGIPS
ncbi:hypothetical protein [Rhodopila sp.]